MFAKAQLRVDDKGATRTYPKTLDGWAKSLEARNHELELAEIKLDAQEQTLRAQVRRAVEGPQKTAEQALPEAQQAAERMVEAAAGVAVATGQASSKEGGSIDTSLETLKDPAKFAATVDRFAKTSGVSAEQAQSTVETLREMKEANAGNVPGVGTSDKAAIDAARNAFFARGTVQSTALAETTRQNPAAEKSNVIDMGAAKRTPAVASVEGTRQTQGAKKAVDDVAGFRKLGRNKTKDAAGRGAPEVGKSASTGKVQQAESASAVRAEAGPRKKFSELNAHEKIERRAEFFGDLRESAGFTRDGKQAVSERAKEAIRPGKQREGHGL
jgi:hypothetical protein